MADSIKISELAEFTGSVTDDLLIPLDDGAKTYKVPVGRFNDGAAGSAKKYAEKAAESATSASASETSAKQIAQEITTNTSAAKDAAKEAEDAKSATVQLKSDTERAAASVGQSVENAASSADSAADSADDATDAALLARSWAVGGTGKREDEDTNSAKYWASVAGAAAGGGVLTFNGRSGAVVPKSGDYSAVQIRRGESNVDIALSELEDTAEDATNVPIKTVVEATDDYPEIVSGETAGVIAGKAKKFLSTLKTALEKAKEDANAQIAKVDKKTSVRLDTKSLTAAGGSLSWTNSLITDTSLVDVYATIPNIAPSEISVSETTLTVTFDAQDAAFDVCVTVRH